LSSADTDLLELALPDLCSELEVDISMITSSVQASSSNCSTTHLTLLFWIQELKYQSLTT
jgi:hypothetical protein